MKSFVKYFLIAFLTQAVFVAVTLNFEPTNAIGEIFAYIFYAGPLMILNIFRGSPKWDISFFELFVLPMIMWSIVMAAGIHRVIWRRKCRTEKFE